MYTRSYLSQLTVIKRTSTYQWTLDVDCIFVVEKACCVFRIDGTDVFLVLASDDHDLPFGSILGDTTELRTTMAPRLQ